MSPSSRGISQSHRRCLLQPTEISYGGFKFLILDMPTQSALPSFIDVLRSHECRDLVRVCEAHYSTELLTAADINVIDLPFSDGSPPPPTVVHQWCDLLKNRLPRTCVAVHCVAGLGRAPVLVAIALMECGMKWHDAVELIRQKRRGAFNTRQLGFLEKYKAKSRLREKSSKKCIIV